MIVEERYVGVIIVSVKGDLTALKVCAALRIAGESAKIWYTSDCANAARHSFHISEAGINFGVTPFFTDLEDYHSIWLRRVRTDRFVPDYVHQHDVPFVTEVSRHYASTIWAGLEQLTRGAAKPIRWINPPSTMRAAEAKMAQLATAQRLGLAG